MVTFSPFAGQSSPPLLTAALTANQTAAITTSMATRTKMNERGGRIDWRFSGISGMTGALPQASSRNVTYR